MQVRTWEPSTDKNGVDALPEGEVVTHVGTGVDSWRAGRTEVGMERWQRGRAMVEECDWVAC